MSMFGKKAMRAVMAGLMASAVIMPSGVAFAANSPSAGTQTGSGQTDLNMILQDTAEHGGTIDPTNPDANNDGLGDNIAFTVPSSINYVVKANGALVGPSEGTAYIENRSNFKTHVSSLDVDEVGSFKIVADASASNADNSVDMQIGPASDMLQASSYLTKSAVATPASWNMAATGAGNSSKVLLKTEGDVSHVTADITSQTKFGTIKWYVTPGEAS